MVGCKPSQRLVVAPPQAPALVDPPERHQCPDDAEVDVRDVVRVADLTEQVGATLPPRERLLVVARVERHVRAGVPGERAERRVVETFGEGRRFLGQRRGPARVEERLGDERPDARWGLVACQLERAVDDAFDDVTGRALGPHPRAVHGSEREPALQVSESSAIVAELDRVLHGLEEPRPVVLESVRLSGHSPQVAARRVVLGELECAHEQPARVDDLVAGQRQLGGATQPMERPASELDELGLRIRPREVHVLRLHRLGVVVGEQRRELVVRLERLEPTGELGVQPSAPRPRQARVRDFARQRVLDRVLALSDHRRPRLPPDEVTLLEHGEVGLREVDQLTDRCLPEDPADHRARLERRLLHRPEQIDPCREHSLDRVRDREVRGERRDRPTAVVPLEDLPIDQTRRQLFDEEGIALGPLDDDVAQLGWKVGREELVEQRCAPPPPRAGRARPSTRCGGPCPRNACGRAAPDALW